MRRMIPIRLKPNSVQAQLHISSAILLFVFTGRSLTTCLFYKAVINSAHRDNSNWMMLMLRGSMLSLFNMLLMEMQAGALDGKQQRRSLSEVAKTTQRYRAAWPSPFKGEDSRDNCSTKWVFHYKAISITDGIHVIQHDVQNLKWLHHVILKINQCYPEVTRTSQNESLNSCILWKHIFSFASRGMVLIYSDLEISSCKIKKMNGFLFCCASVGFPIDWWENVSRPQRIPDRCMSTGLR